MVLLAGAIPDCRRHRDHHAIGPIMRKRQFGTQNSAIAAVEPSGETNTVAQTAYWKVPTVCPVNQGSAPPTAPAEWYEYALV